jgi:hypothetical protein
MAHQYVVLTVQLGWDDPDSVDFALVRSGTAKHLVGLEQDALALRGRLAGLSVSGDGEQARKTMLLGQVDAMLVRLKQLEGRNRTFDEESRLLFGVVAPPDTGGEERRQVRDELAVLLGGSDDLDLHYAGFEGGFVIPTDKVPAVMQAALTECRAQTAQHMKLPSDEHVDVEYVGNKPWSAFSEYLGGDRSVIRVNLDAALTVDRVLNLACHEGYPGHHVFNMIRDRAVAQGMGLEEFRVQPTFSPQSYVSEAAASYAPQLALSDQERLRVERDVLMPLAGIKPKDVELSLRVEKLVDALQTAEPEIAREYLDGQLEWARALEALRLEALMEHGEATLTYLNEFRGYMLAYTVGLDSVKSLVESGGAKEQERWARYQELMLNPVVRLPERK